MKKAFLTMFFLFACNGLLSAQTDPKKSDQQKPAKTQQDQNTVKASDSDFQNKKAEEAKQKQEIKRKEMKEKAKIKEEEIKNSKP